MTKKYPSTASGASFSAIAKDEHARIAVLNAMSKLPSQCTIGSVILFLSSAYAYQPQNAIREAARASGSLDINGCCSIGIFSDEAVIHTAEGMEGAVALVFSHEHSFLPESLALHHKNTGDLSFNLSSPNALTMAVNNPAGGSGSAVKSKQFGAACCDEFGEGPFSIWQNGQIIEREFSHSVYAADSRYMIRRSDSFRPISPLLQINRAGRHTLVELEQQSAADSLEYYQQQYRLSSNSTIVPEIVAAVSTFGGRDVVEQGELKIHHIISVDSETKQVALSGEIKAGRYFYWAVRDADTAQQKLLENLSEVRSKIAFKANYALMFSNASRGPDFYSGKHRDMELFCAEFPNLPMVGIYSSAEITNGYRDSAESYYHTNIFGLFG